MKNLEFDKVDINSGFFHDKKLLNENVTINAVYNRFADTGRIDAFNLEWKEGDDNKPHYYWDSDVAKWIEGAAYILKKKYDKSLYEKIENLIDKIEKGQDDDGYFNIYFTVCEPGQRFTKRSHHELYCAGHLAEAAVAYYEATGKDRFLNCMIKYMKYIKKVFITDKSASFSVPGHEEIELALIRMYRCTKDKDFLDMAVFFVNERGRGEDPLYASVTNKNDQSHLPVREQFSAEGHAVRACYLYCAMADIAFELNDTELFKVCKAIFNDIVNTKMYITGGIGSTRIGEAFTLPYDLRNDNAYAETCASISMMFFAHRMLQMENNAIYADVIEREIYNGILSGLSIDGKAFFYENPLEINLDNYRRYRSTTNGETFAITQRKEIFECSCCPPNINRVLSSIEGYLYGYDDGTIWVNQFADSKAQTDGMEICQHTDYPNSGRVSIETKNVKCLYVRIPGWCTKYLIDCDYEITDGYAKIVNPPECIEIDFEMKPVLYESNPLVCANAGKVAVGLGPVIYCAEQIDNCTDVWNLYIDKDFSYKIYHDDVLSANCLEFDGFYKNKADKLYGIYSQDFEKCKVKLIPFSCFANRGESNMKVWLNIR